MKKKTLAIALSSLFLAACGSESSDSDNVKSGDYLYTGKVVNIQSAKVFFDMNQNGKRDTDEPMSMSDSSGAYSFTVPSSKVGCLKYTPVVASVNEDSIYIDTGAQVDSEFELAYAPSYVKQPITLNQNITALTTMEWSRTPMPVTPEGNFKDCSRIGTNSGIDDDYAFFPQQQTVVQTKSDLISRYNITTEEFREDYISTNNTKIKELSENILRGLENSKSIKEDFDLNSQPHKRIGFTLVDVDSLDWEVQFYTLSNNSLTYDRDIYSNNLNTLNEKKDSFIRDYGQRSGSFYYFDEKYVNHKDSSCVATEYLLDTTGTSNPEYKDYNYAKNIITGDSKTSCNNPDYLTETLYRIHGEYTSSPDNISNNYEKISNEAVSGVLTGMAPFSYNIKDNFDLYDEELHHDGLKSALNIDFASVVLCDKSFEETRININSTISSMYDREVFNKTPYDYSQDPSTQNCDIAQTSHKKLITQSDGNLDTLIQY